MKDDLIQAVQAVRETFPAVDLAGWRVFVDNLAFVYQVITATESLLREATSRTVGPLKAYYAEHLGEEKNHARWLAEDLASASIDVSKMALSPEAVAMAGSQYYLIHHVDPVALLGYMAVLECFPMPLGTVEALECVHGKDLCRTLRHHAEHDPNHGADVLDQIDALDAREFELVKRNAVQTALYMRAAIEKFNGGNHA